MIKFNPFKKKQISERKLGKTFTYYNVKLKPIEGLVCNGCYFFEDEKCVCDRVKIGSCIDETRSDKKEVVFIQIL